MEEFLTIASSFPTAVYTVLVLASFAYWMVGFVGLAGDGGDGDADVGDAGDADVGDAGDADVGDAGDAGDGDVGDAESDVGHAHGKDFGGKDVGGKDIGDADDSGGVFGGIMAVLTFLRLRHAPLSVTFSILFLFSWVFTYFGARHGMELIPGPEWLAGGAVALGGLIASIPLTSLLTKPLAPIFHTETAPGPRHLVGQVGIVRIEGGKKTSAQVKLKEPGAGQRGLLLRVATDEDVAVGDEVLIVDYDEEKNAYVAEPMDAVLPSKKSDG